jgi:hypothetical protein
MNGIVYYAVIIAVGIALIVIATRLYSKRSRAWRECAERYRLNFKEGEEERNGQKIYVFRIKGYYRTCLISISASKSGVKEETIITISYPKNLLNNLSTYPQGLLVRISRGIARQLASKNPSGQPFNVSLPAAAGGAAKEVEKELNPFLREKLIQLFLVCGEKPKQLEITDAYIMNRHPGSVRDPAHLFPIIDLIIEFINQLETYIDDLLV